MECNESPANWKRIGKDVKKYTEMANSQINKSII